MKTTINILCALALFTATQLPAQVVPEYVNYQGLLKAADGSPLATGNYTLEFNIYDKANPGGDTKVWGPFLFDGNTGNGHGLLVPVVNGSFNVIIGPKDTGARSITNAFSAPNRFIEIKVNNGAAILPRQQFLSTAYALQSQKAQLADVAASLVKELADALCPPGTIVAFGGTSIPDGWMLCDGRLLTNALYPRLFAAIGTNWGNGTLDSTGTAESPPNPDTGFNLPDLRGIFLRGVNGSLTGPWVDPDATTRTTRYAGNTGNKVGSIQANTVVVHNHIWGQTTTGDDNGRKLQSWTSATAAAASDFIQHNNADNNSAPGNWTTGYTGDDTMKVGTADAVATVYTQPTSTIPQSGETRPNNAYVNYIIKY